MLVVNGVIYQKTDLTVADVVHKYLVKCDLKKASVVAAFKEVAESLLRFNIPHSIVGNGGIRVNNGKQSITFAPSKFKEVTPKEFVLRAYQMQMQ